MLIENNFYRVNISKWLPMPDSGTLLPSSSSYAKMIVLKNAITMHMQNIVIINDQKYQYIDSCCPKTLNNMRLELKNIINHYEYVYAMQITRNPHQIVNNYKVDYLFLSIMRSLLSTAKFYHVFINRFINDKDDEMTHSIFRLVNVYNAVLELKSEIIQQFISIFTNDCPSMLDAFNKIISTSRVLYILARNEAEEYCHEVIDCLLTIYRPCAEQKLKTSPSTDEFSENSSVEIYRALTNNMTPLHTSIAPVESMLAIVSDGKDIALNNIGTIQALLINRIKQIKKSIVASKDIMVYSFISGNIIKCDGEEISKYVLEKILNYFQRIAWAAISEILDHILLWWSSEGIVIRYNHSGSTRDFQNWLHEFMQDRKNNVPMCVKSSLLNLCDAVGSHVTVTCWDDIFRLAYIAAFENTSKPLSIEGTDIGHMFTEVFKLLISLSNKCEIGSEWMIGAPLMELALSEQITILHRLDHSIHIMRLWASQESKLIAHTWELDNFFLIVKGDLSNCINELSYLKLADHTMELTIDCGTISDQIHVCARMRSKIVSEVNANILLLKKSSSASIDILAKICRVISMANLHMCFPMADCWSKSVKNEVGDHKTTSSYVKIYLERVLLPVLEGLEDREISNMVLTIMCEAWLDYIYLDKIKFSEFGSYQLLRDFAYVSQWVTECPIISQDMKSHLLHNEVLKRCEGVGRLLLRHPGEAIAMQKRGGGIPTLRNVDESSSSTGLERMPAEMYVPNQKQWLELRAGKSYALCGYFKRL